MVHSGAILYSTFSSGAIKQLIVSHYDLDDSVECTLFSRGLNDTYLLSARDRQFALRLYRSRWRTRAAVMGEVAALLHISAKGVPVATPIARSDGELVTDVDAPEGPRWAVLFDWVNGDEPIYRNATHAQLYGRLAAQLHIAGDDLPSGATRSPLDLNYLLERPLASLRPAMKSRPLLAARFDALADRVRARLEGAKDQLWDWGFCHGDLHCGNAHVDGEHLSLYDFDCCGPGWRLYDLATYRWAARVRQFEEGAWKPFSEAYLQVRPAVASTLDLVPLFVILRHIWLQGYYVWNSVEAGVSFQSDGYFSYLVTFCEQIESEYLNQ
jgi:Ser/Thr protein kinase RdoA (MazF antagonist)